MVKDDQTKGKDETYAFRWLTSALLFGLLLEWIHPWSKADVWSSPVIPVAMTVFIGVLLAVSLLRLPLLWEIVIDALAVILTLAFIFHGESGTLLQFLVQWPIQTIHNVEEIIYYGLSVMSGEVRTLLLLIGIAMLIPALQRLMWLRLTGISMVAFTLVYLVALHVWLGFAVTSGMLRAILLGMLLTSVTLLPRIQKYTEQTKQICHSSHEKKMYWRWYGRTAAAIVTVYLLTMLLVPADKPYYEQPKWVEAASQHIAEFFEQAGHSSSQGTAVTAMASNETSTGQSLSGYSFDDSKLGEPFQEDESVFFRAYTPVQGYWRGEAKNYYDGAGWSSEADTMATSSYLTASDEDAVGNSGQKDSGIPGNEQAVIRQTIIFAKPQSSFPFFASGHQGKLVKQIAANPRRSLYSYIENNQTSAIYPASSQSLIEQYTVDSTLPVTDEAVFLLDQQISAFAERSGMSEERSEAIDLLPYLQLPKELPARVAALAAEVSGTGVNNRYEQVKAVEQFLKSSYAYTQSDSTLPGKNKDFTDHFLFEQKQGYCVHFSTAMVVMLRTQQIPARWVKGFAPGIELSVASDSAEEGKWYEVRGSDAHAWVEVYFDSLGWVPFDPTPGYGGQNFSNETIAAQMNKTSAGNEGNLFSSSKATGSLGVNNGTGAATHAQEQEAKESRQQFWTSANTIAAILFSEKSRGGLSMLKQAFEQWSGKIETAAAALWNMLVENNGKITIVTLYLFVSFGVALLTVLLWLLNQRKITGYWLSLRYRRAYERHKRHYALFSKRVENMSMKYNQYNEEVDILRNKTPIAFSQKFQLEAGEELGTFVHSLDRQTKRKNRGNEAEQTAEIKQRDESLRLSYLLYSEHIWEQVYQIFTYKRSRFGLTDEEKRSWKESSSMLLTNRERLHSIRPLLGKQQLAAAEKLLDWYDEAVFDRKQVWQHAPNPKQIKEIYSCICRNESGIVMASSQNGLV